MTKKKVDYDMRHGVVTPVTNYKDIVKVGDKVTIMRTYSEVEATIVKINKVSVEISVPGAGRDYIKKVDRWLTVDGAIRSQDIILHNEIGLQYIAEVQQNRIDQKRYRRENKLNDLIREHDLTLTDIAYIYNKLKNSSQEVK